MLAIELAWHGTFGYKCYNECVHAYREEELKRMEEFRKAKSEVEKKNEKPMSQKMFKAI